MAPPKRRRLTPAARREEILDAAERVIRKHGAVRARVEDVVREAGSAKGIFYLHLDSWETLLIALRTRIYAEFDTRFPIAASGGAQVPWPLRVELLLRGFFDFVPSRGKLHEAVFHGAIAHRPAPPSTPSRRRASSSPRSTRRSTPSRPARVAKRMLRVTTEFVCRDLDSASENPAAAETSLRTSERRRVDLVNSELAA